jgi:cysteine synthase A
MCAPTPVVEVDGIFAKVECLNPTGSIKDRIAEFIIDESERLGLLEPGMTIVEATSGNTGIALARYGRSKGYKVVIVMPENMTEERKQRVREYGATLILCGAGDFAEAVTIRDDLARQPGCFNPDQFSNELNVRCHEATTGPELIRQVPAKIDVFVAGVGTGGSLMGVGRAIKKHNPNAEVVAVEPEEAAVMSGQSASHHRIFGIGDGFIPPIAQNESGGVHELIDSVHTVHSDEALAAAAHLRDEFGMCVGISSGANFVVAKRYRDQGRTVATLFADGFVKYQSHGLRQAMNPPCPFAAECCR